MQKITKNIAILGLTVIGVILAAGYYALTRAADAADKAAHLQDGDSGEHSVDREA